MLETDNQCLTCFQTPGSDCLDVLNEKSGTVAEALRNHFWFTELDFDRAILCHTCWNQVNSFHRFYCSVQILYKHRILIPAEQALKQEPDPEEVVEYLDESSLDLCDERGNGDIKDEPVGSFSEGDDENTNGTDLPEDPQLVSQDVEVDSENECQENEKSQKRKLPKRPTKSESERFEEDLYIREHVKYICEECGEDSSTFTLFLKHSQDFHGKKTTFLSCCGKKYFKKVRLYQHVQAVNNPDTFRCEQCQRNFSDNEGIKRHMKEFHATEEERKFKCDRCPKSFVNGYKFKLHMQDHLDWDNKTCKCEHCGKIFKSRSILNNHVKLKHTEPTEFICDICAKGFHLKSRFLQHKLEHEDPSELKVQCQICLRWLKNRLTWRRHMHQHEHTAAKCDLCGHVSPHARALKGHIRRQHGQSKPQFQCTDCPKTFCKAITLREHVAAIHTGDILYSCPFCEKTFNSHANMHSHKKKMHHDEWWEQHNSRYYSK